MSVWDDPEIREGGEFFKFDQVGDTISGTITAVRSHKFEDGKVAPQILLRTDAGDERTVTAGQVRLKAALAEQRPEAGDHLTITYTQKEPRAGGKTLKHFTVIVRRAGTPGAATTAAAPVNVTVAAVPADPDPAPAGVDATVWQQMDESQRDSMRALLGLSK